MKRHLGLMILICHLGSEASAGNISLGTDTSPASPLVMKVGTTSDLMLVNVTNDVNPDDPQNFLAGWQVLLRIVPLEGKGTLRFQPAATGKPESDYIFAGLTTLGGPNFEVPPGLDTLFNFAAPVQFTTVEVPTAPGANLFQTAFDASQDAYGSFGVFAVAGAGRSEWGDAGINVRDYANLPGDGGNVQIGQVTVSPLADLTKNGFVDFADLTILLANWNQNVGPESGNLVSPEGTVVNFDDLTVLLAGWTGPGGAPSPDGVLDDGGQQVPEPSTLLLAGLGVLAWLPTRSRRAGKRR